MFDVVFGWIMNNFPRIFAICKPGMFYQSDHFTISHREKIVVVFSDSFIDISE